MFTKLIPSCLGFARGLLETNTKGKVIIEETGVSNKHKQIFGVALMTVDAFDYLLALVSDDLKKCCANWRKLIASEERLLLILHRVLFYGEQPSLLAASRGSWNVTSVRTNVRNHFPRPNERKRVKTHGWLTRMSTPGGRRVLMRRILKGRHVLSH